MGCSKIEYDEDLKIVTVTYSGEFTHEKTKEIIGQRIAFGKEKNTNCFLLDMKNLLMGKGSLFDVLEVPEQIYKGQEMPHSSRTAIIKPDDPKVLEGLEFFKTVCINRGWVIKLFDEREEAIEWLKKFQ